MGCDNCIHNNEDSDADGLVYCCDCKRWHKKNTRYFRILKDRYANKYEKVRILKRSE